MKNLLKIINCYKRRVILKEVKKWKNKRKNLFNNDTLDKTERIILYKDYSHIISDLYIEMARLYD